MNKLDKLIEEFCPDGMEYKELSELFHTRNGYTPSKGNKEFWENGSVPWFRMEDIRENGNILSKAIQYVSEKAVKGKLFPENSIIVATSDLEKQLSVLNANLHQAEIIKTRLEQQMDNLDVTDIHYDKKISDLQRRLDTQYDKIDEVEEAIVEALRYFQMIPSES